jgi:hypothetical protein
MVPVRCTILFRYTESGISVTVTSWRKGTLGYRRNLVLKKRRLSSPFWNFDRLFFVVARTRRVRNTRFSTFPGNDCIVGHPWRSASTRSSWVKENALKSGPAIALTHVLVPPGRDRALRSELRLRRFCWQYFHTWINGHSCLSLSKYWKNREPLDIHHVWQIRSRIHALS